MCVCVVLTNSKHPSKFTHIIAYVSTYQYIQNVCVCLQVKKRVAVKVFLDGQDIDNSSISELLDKSKQARHLLHAYRYVIHIMVQFTLSIVYTCKPLCEPCW